MKKLKAFLIIIVIIGNILILSGCWDYSEINEHAIVTGLAIDKISEGQGFSITVEIVDLREADKEAHAKSKRIESEGMTIGDALRNVVKVSGKTLYWSHAEIIIIGKNVAKQGILPVVDTIYRQYQPRLTMNVLISKDETARELLSQQSITSEIRAIEMKTMINSEKWILSKAPHVHLCDFINELSGDGIAAALPMVGIVQNEGEKTSELSGTAIFKEDKLIGMLNDEESKFFLFVRNQVNGGVLMLNENSTNFSKEITFQIKDNNTKVTPVYTDGKLTMGVYINTKVTLGELGVSENLIDEKGIEKLEGELEKTIITNIDNVVNKVKIEYDSDIFGFGSIVKREMPSLWKSINTDWGVRFRSLPVNINANVEIIDTGLASKPIKVGD